MLTGPEFYEYFKEWQKLHQKEVDYHFLFDAQQLVALREDDSKYEKIETIMITEEELAKSNSSIIGEQMLIRLWQGIEAVHLPKMPILLDCEDFLNTFYKDDYDYFKKALSIPDYHLVMESKRFYELTNSAELCNVDDHGYYTKKSEQELVELILTL